LAPAVSRFVTVGGCRLEYQWHGPPGSKAPTIVFLHQGLGSISQWRDFPASLCARLGCGGLVYNRLGYGGSDPLGEPFTPTFMHHEALDVLPRLLATLGIARPVLFGHSDGGSIALLYAGSGLGEPRALVLEAPHVLVEAITVTSIAALRNAYASTPLRERLEQHHGPHADPLFHAWSRIWLSREFRDWNIESSLPAITCPVLVIQGRDDEYGTERQMDAIAAGVSGSVETLILDACRHSPHVDQRDAVDAAVTRFLLTSATGTREG